MSMSKQEIFTRVAVHLLRQGRPSLGEGGRCMYRGDNGLKCAVGALIPDELCTPPFLEFENGAGVMSLDVQRTLWAAGVLVENEFEKLIFLRDLQVIHDTYQPELWHEALVTLAEHKGLQMPRLEDVDSLNETAPAKISTTEVKEGATHE